MPFGNGEFDSQPGSPLSDDSIFDRDDVDGGLSDGDEGDAGSEGSAATDLSLGLKYNSAITELKLVKASIIRRTKVMEDLRKAYLKDIVTMKHVINDILTGTERESVMAAYNSRLPSIDLKQPLVLFAPPESQFLVKPCENCGGFLDLTISDNSKVKALEKVVESYKLRQEQLCIKIATLDAEAETRNQQHESARQEHKAEVSMFI